MDDTLTPTVNRAAQLAILAPGASPEEAAAVVAALERFVRETAPTPVAPAPGAWQRAGLQEGVVRDPGPPAPWA